MKKEIAVAAVAFLLAAPGMMCHAEANPGGATITSASGSSESDWKELAQMLKDNKQEDAAAKIQALISTKPLMNHSASLPMMKQLDKVCFQIKRKDLAIEIQKQIIEYLQASPNISGVDVADELMNAKAMLSAYSFDVGDYRNSVQLSEEVLPQMKKKYGEENKRTLFVMNQLGMGYYVIGKYADSLRLHEEAAVINKKVYGEHSREYLLSLNGIASAQLRMGKTFAAQATIQTMRPLISIALKEEDTNYPAVMDTLACYYTDMGQIQDALAIRRQLLSWYEKFAGSDVQGQATLRYNISHNLHDLGHHVEALENDQRGFVIANEAYGKSHRTTLLMMGNLVEDYISLTKYNEASNIAKEALAISREAWGEENPLTLRAMHNMAMAYHVLEDYQKSKDTNLEICRIRDKMVKNGDDPASKLKSMGNLARDYISLGDLPSAVKIDKELLEEFTKFVGENHPDTIGAMVNLARDYAQAKDYKSALALCEKTMLLRNSLPPDSELVTRIVDTAALSYVLSGQYEKSTPLYKELLSCYETERDKYGALSTATKSQWFASKIGSYKRAIYSYLETGAVEDAFQAAELCKARGLVEQYSDQLASNNGVFRAEDAEKLHAYQVQIGAYEKAIRRADERGDDDTRIKFENEQTRVTIEFDAFKKSLQSKYPQYKTMSGMDILDVTKGRGAIPSGSCYIDFLTFREENKIFAFVVKSAGQIEGLVLDVDGKFFENCQLYHELLAYPTLESMRIDNKYLWKLESGEYRLSEGRQMPERGAALVSQPGDLNTLRESLAVSLGDALLVPIEKHISSASSWIVSTDADLSSIPFETISMRGKPAIQSADISYVPSLAVLRLMREHEEKNVTANTRKGIFAMGNAVYGGSDIAEHRGSMAKMSDDIKAHTFDLKKLKWNNLPGTEKELNMVSEIFGSHEIFRGQDASESNLKALNKSGELSNYKYLLFATHGIFVPKFPELSSIVLSQGRASAADDGYITVGEWMGYHLNSDLVYLSACESGLGEYQAGEGIIGIPYALCIAGNKDTVMSLWKVNDEIAADFSKSFFEKLSRGDSPVKAMNSTKREFMANANAKYNNPSAWSAFLLYGI